MLQIDIGNVKKSEKMTSSVSFCKKARYNIIPGISKNLELVVFSLVLEAQANPP